MADEGTPQPEGTGGGSRRGPRKRGGQGGGGRPAGQSRPGGGRPGGQASGGERGRGKTGAGQPSPVEVATRSTRNALRRHAESVKDEQSQLACRSVLIALVGATRDASSPAETLTVVEQVVHVLEAGRKEEAQLPIVVRAAVAFSIETSRRMKDVAEMLRLVLRHTYCLAADHIPRQLRDDGGFRASALKEVLAEIASDYLSDAKFQAMAR